MWFSERFPAVQILRYVQNDTKLYSVITYDTPPGILTEYNN